MSTRPKLDELETVIRVARALHKRASTIKKLVDDGHVQAWGNSRRLLVKRKDVEQAILDTTAYIPPKFRESAPKGRASKQPAPSTGKLHRLVKI